MQTLRLINGEYSEVVPADDRGLQYGDGLFETLAVVNGQPLLWDAHLQRLQRGCEQLRIPCPDSARLLQESLSLTTKTELAVLKIIITRGSGGRGYSPPDTPDVRRIISLHAWPDYPASYYREGVSLGICKTRLSSNPELAGLKHLNRLEQVLARAELASNPANAEALVRAQDGRLIEGTQTNLFLIRNGQALTPAIRDCGIAGVMRAEVINSLGVMGVNCEETDLQLSDLQTADELLLSNSLAGLWPVSRLTIEQARAVTIGPLYQALSSSLRAQAKVWIPDNA